MRFPSSRKDSARSHGGRITGLLALSSALFSIKVTAAAADPCKAIVDTLKTNQKNADYAGYFPAKMAYDCLKALPLNKEYAQQTADGLLGFHEVLSYQTYFKNPPTPELETPAHDGAAEIAKIQDNVKNGKYKGLYEFTTDVYKVFTNYRDGHTIYMPGLHTVFTYAHPFSIVSVADKATSQPKIWTLNEERHLDKEVVEIDGQPVIDYLVTLANSTLEPIGFADPDTRFNVLMSQFPTVAPEERENMAFFQFVTQYPGVDKFTMKYADGTKEDVLWYARLNDYETDWISYLAEGVEKFAANMWLTGDYWEEESRKWTPEEAIDYATALGWAIVNEMNVTSPDVTQTGSKKKPKHHGVARVKTGNDDFNHPSTKKGSPHPKFGSKNHYKPNGRRIRKRDVEAMRKVLRKMRKRSVDEYDEDEDVEYVDADVDEDETELETHDGTVEVEVEGDYDTDEGDDSDDEDDEDGYDYYDDDDEEYDQDEATTVVHTPTKTPTSTEDDYEDDDDFEEDYISTTVSSPTKTPTSTEDDYEDDDDYEEDYISTTVSSPTKTPTSTEDDYEDDYDYEEDYITTTLSSPTTTPTTTEDTTDDTSYEDTYDDTTDDTYDDTTDDTTKPPTSGQDKGYPEYFNATDNGSFKFYSLDGETAVLDVSSFSAQSRADRVQASDLLDYGLDYITSTRHKYLIIDLTNNGGGAAFLPFDFARMLFPKKYIFESVNMRYTKANYVSLKNSNLGDWWTTEDKDWPSLEDLFRPVDRDGDKFTQMFRYDHLQITSDDGYGVDPKQEQPFPAENIVVLGNGYCGSACFAWFEALYRQGVRSYAMGGRPNGSKYMQTSGGIKGGVVYSFDDYIKLKKFYEAFDDDRAQKVAKILPGPLRLWTAYDALNVENQFRNGEEDQLPLEFRYNPACKRFAWTKEMMVDTGYTWKFIREQAWDKNGKATECEKAYVPEKQYKPTTTTTEEKKGIHRGTGGNRIPPHRPPKAHKGRQGSRGKKHATIHDESSFEHSSPHHPKPKPLHADVVPTHRKGKKHGDVVPTRPHGKAKKHGDVTPTNPQQKNAIHKGQKEYKGSHPRINPKPPKGSIPVKDRKPGAKEHKKLKPTAGRKGVHKPGVEHYKGKFRKGPKGGRP